MKKIKKMWHRTLWFVSLTVLSVVVGMAFSPLHAADIEKIHFLIPGGAGGGWDGTARGTGEALTKSGLVQHASYENMSGGGGGKAIGYMIETAQRQNETLMVNSTPIVVRSITKVFPYSFRDLTPIAGIIADSSVFAVHIDSPFKSWNDVVTAFKANPRKVTVGGGSVPGDLDHISAALAMQAAGGNPKKVRYIPYDAGGKAMAGLLTGEIKVLSTGFGEALELSKNGQIRLLAITSETRSKDAPDVPTLKELGYDMTFANWRGFFGPPNLQQDRVDSYLEVLEKMYDTADWETVRSRRGWSNQYVPGPKFTAFLEGQEEAISGMLKELGFLK